jgi:hypothetical protein
MNNLRRLAGTALLVAAAVLPWGSEPRAEVGVTRSSSSGPLRLYVFSIVDEPDPFSSPAWTRHNGDTTGRAVLNDVGIANGDGRPALLVTPSGTPLVAWARNSPDGYDVVLSRFENDGWTEPEVLAGGPYDELDPQLVTDPADGSIHVVYWVAEATPRILHREAPADLSSWSAADQVSGSGDPACRPHAAFHAGAMRVVYEVHDFGIGSSPRQVVLATEAGLQYTTEMVAVTLHEEPVRAYIHSAGGRMWVDWIDSVDQIAWIRLEAGGWGVVQTEDYLTPEERDYHVRGAIRSLAVE